MAHPAQLQPALRPRSGSQPSCVRSVTCAAGTPHQGGTPAEPQQPSREHALVLAAKERRTNAHLELIESFMPLIAGIARRYEGSRLISREDLIQEGVVGLLRALERYDPASGTPFWAYARWWVRDAMQRLWAELTRPVALSDSATRQLARVKRARRALAQRRGSDPSMGELSLAVGIERERVERLLMAAQVAHGLDHPISGDPGADTIGDRLADPRAEDAYERVAVTLNTAGLYRLLAQLSERERTVLCGRYGLDGEQRTLAEIGAGLRVSAERVRQIEADALAKLRTLAASRARHDDPRLHWTAQRGERNGRTNQLAQRAHWPRESAPT